MTEASNIVLTGPSGAGKSAVGRILADLTQRVFLDMDLELERTLGCTIAEYFEEHGEAAFRERESALCTDIASRAGLVVAAGGGAILEASNVRALAAGGILVNLTASLDTLVRRLEGADDRPLLRGDHRRALQALMDERRAAYESVPVQIDTDGLSPEQVARSVAGIVDALEAVGRIDVGTGTGGYPIFIDEGLLPLAGLLMRGHLGRPRATAVIVNPTVAARHAGPLLRSLRDAGFTAYPVEIPDGEQHKTPEQVQRLWAAFLEAGLDRSGLVVSLGGGVTGDLAGFAAATYMRGIPVVHVPTTLLAMVDASVGGKTGVDLPQGKNLVGAFKQPEMVIVDTLTLGTLPAGQIAAGMAEVIKHGLIGDASLFQLLEARRPEDPGTLVHRALRVKVAIVEKDPGETGPRTLLNLGHTFGHGFEAASGYTLGHGPSVAAGLVAAARLARDLGRCEVGLVERVERTVRMQDLPARLSGLDVVEVIGHMSHDKKRWGSIPRFVIPEEPGHAAIISDPPERLVADAVAHVLES